MIEKFLLRPDIIQAVTIVIGVLLLAGILSLWSKMRVIEKLQMLDEDDLKSVKGLKSIIERFTMAVDKLEQLTLSHEVSNAKHKLEIDNIKTQIISLEARIKKLEDKIHA